MEKLRIRKWIKLSIRSRYKSYLDSSVAYDMYVEHSISLSIVISELSERRSKARGFES